VIIFDLDGTTICSKHRQATLADGSLDLASWMQNSTAEKIARDSLLPLADFWRSAIAAQIPVIVCTARVMAESDYNFLARHGLSYTVCLSRKAGDNTPDATLKALALKAYAKSIGYTWAHFCARVIAYDDNPSVLRMYAENNIRAIRVNAA
jgi:hypothetical protein